MFYISSRVHFFDGKADQVVNALLKSLEPGWLAQTWDSNKKFVQLYYFCAILFARTSVKHKGGVHILGEICPRSDQDIAPMEYYLDPLKFI